MAIDDEDEVDGIGGGVLVLPLVLVEIDPTSALGGALLLVVVVVVVVILVVDVVVNRVVHWVDIVDHWLLLLLLVKIEGKEGKREEGRKRKDRERRKKKVGK
ncbi:hypothetical protein FRC18_009545 [Serendipita sp. 400]|nr:hypothetical protein FRC18_009545 [Serendipita sp. 400]